MAHTTTFVGTGTQTNLPALIQQLVGRVRAHAETRRQQAQLRWELSRYSNRELADMGLSRADIDGIVAGSRVG